MTHPVSTLALIEKICLFSTFIITGMAGKDAQADAVLGGASDFMTDIFAHVIKIYYAKDDEKVIMMMLCFVNGLY